MINEDMWQTVAISDKLDDIEQLLCQHCIDIENHDICINNLHERLNRLEKVMMKNNWKRNSYKVHIPRRKG